MKKRRHHNNKGYRQIKRGKTRDDVDRIARKLGVPTSKYSWLEWEILLAADKVESWPQWMKDEGKDK